MGVMQNDGKPAQVGIRLKLNQDHKIIRAEHIIAPVTDRGAANLAAPRAGLLATVPASEREPRDQLIKEAAAYYNALDDNDGSFAPFAADCERHENGMVTVAPKLANPLKPDLKKPDFLHMGCKGQLDTKLFTYITTIGDRRVEVADPVTGLVADFSHFHHEMKQKVFPIVGVPGVKTRTMDYKPFDLPALHIFKVRDHQIHEIEAMGFMAPYNSPTGWE